MVSKTHGKWNQEEWANSRELKTKEDVSKCAMGRQQGQCVMCGATLKVLTSLADQLLSSEDTRVQRYKASVIMISNARQGMMVETL